MSTNRSLRFAQSIRATAKLKLAESRLSVRDSTWVEVSVARAWLYDLVSSFDVGEAFAPPQSRVSATTFDGLNSPAYLREVEQRRRELADWNARLDQFVSLGNRVSLPPMPERDTLASEIAQVQEAIDAGELDITMLKGLLAWLKEKDQTLRRRISATVPSDWLREVAESVRRAVEQYTGIAQVASFPPIPEPTPKFLREFSARA